MSNILSSVNQRTQLAGHNRLELLLFHLSGKQIYGINVFKVKEVLQCPAMTVMPKSHPVIRGVAHIRGETIAILDMSRAMGDQPLSDTDSCFVIVTEYNRRIQGFLVKNVDRIVNLNWEKIHPPPKGAGPDHYLTAVTKVDEELVEIIDVEKIMAEVSPHEVGVSKDLLDRVALPEEGPRQVLIVDDSSVARKQIKRALESLGLEIIEQIDGSDALGYLLKLVEGGNDPADQLLMVVSDIEMPEMDGYTLTTALRSDSRFDSLFIVLHSSLSGGFNEAMVKKVGADRFLSKFKADELAEVAIERIKLLTSGG